MSVPTRVNYDEAIQMSRVRLQIKDPELKQGQVEVVKHKTKMGIMPSPWGMEGGFAIVYKFRTQSGQLRALRCFKTKMPANIKERYQKIGAYFKSNASQITAEFKYHEPGIKVQVGMGSKKPYPLIEMEWVNGVTLLKQVDKLCRKKDKAALGKLAEQWLELLAIMRRAKIGHSDLAASNVMVRSDGQLVLIDYDGVYIPDFAGMNAITLGQPDYQHPQMQQRPFNERMDDFSALVIYIALLALHLQPGLWNTFTERDDKGGLLNENLLFKQEDFIDPNKSKLFKSLAKLKHSELKDAVRELEKACKQSVQQIQIPRKLFEREHEEQQALALLTAAIKKNDDEEIVAKWTPLLEKYAPAQAYRTRVELAQRRLEALAHFRKALFSKNEQKIVNAYDSVLDQYDKVLPAERQQLNDAENVLKMPARVREAIKKDDDQGIIAAYERKLLRSFMNFTPAEAERIRLAELRQTALLRFRQALKSDDDEKIIANYDPILNGYSLISAREQKRLDLAKTRQNALQKFRRALWSKNEQEIVSAYDPILDKYDKVLFTERQRLEEAQRYIAIPARVRKAIKKDDDKAIVEAYEESLLRPFMKFSPEEQERIKLAQQRQKALLRFRKALMNDDDDLIVASYDPILDNDAQISPINQKRLELARRRKFALLKFRQALWSSQDDQQIIAAYDPILDKYDKVLPAERQRLAEVQARLSSQEQEQQAKQANEEQERVNLAQQRQNALLRFRQALMSRNAQQIVSAYDPILDNHKKIWPAERELLKQAQNALQMSLKVRQAIKSNNNQAIVAVYDGGLARIFSIFSADEQQRIDDAIKQINLKKPQVPERNSHLPRRDQNGQKKSQPIALLDPTDLTVELLGDELFAQWQWPTNNSIQMAAVTWRIDRFPKQPGEAGTQTHYITRSAYRRARGFRHQIGPIDKIYVQLFSAIKHSTQPEGWHHSAGQASTSKKKLLRGPFKIKWYLTNKKGSPRNELVIQTTDGKDLPELVIIRKEKGLPLGLHDGELIYRTSDNHNIHPSKAIVPLDITSWPRQSILRIFAAHEQDAINLVVYDKKGVKIEVN